MGLYGEGDRERIVPVAVYGEEEAYRVCWRRDYARVIHSAAFRRLQGKTQLFPGVESDYFRNRLSHSLEAAQIARSIAIRLNYLEKFLQEPGNAIEADVVEVAALCHDLGHPPFGHNGERALDECMKSFGGFEGNAQTLRILARLEKRENPSADPAGFHGPKDDRCGLNLTARVLASTLKYDNKIAFDRKETDSLEKGYYEIESDVVTWFKRKVAGQTDAPFKTVECQIMDIADDIAYSTYDLEDALKAGFIIPLDLSAAETEILEEVARQVSVALQTEFTAERARAVLSEIVEDIALVKGGGKQPIDIASAAYRTSLNLSKSGYLRVEFTSQMVREFIDGVRFKPNDKIPALSSVQLAPEIREKVEVLKRFNYVSLIMSPRLKVAEFRGGDIIKTIFEALADKEKEGNRLLPDDFQRVFKRIEGHHQKRVISDFIAGMTDRYALEFYGRLRSENPQTIFKPL